MGWDNVGWQIEMAWAVRGRRIWYVFRGVDLASGGAHWMDSLEWWSRIGGVEWIGWCGINAFGTTWIRGICVFISAWTGMGGLGSCVGWHLETAGSAWVSGWGGEGWTYLVCLWWLRFDGVGQVGGDLEW